MSKIKKQYLMFLLGAAVFLLAVRYFLPKQDMPENQEPETSRYLSEEYIQGEYLKDPAFSDVKYFPMAYLDGDAAFYFEDSFGGARTYGGDRVHEGTDIMTPDNVRGTYPVVAVCDGTVTNMGWLKLGGYRVGITSGTGVYYYYAHLYRYDEALSEGSRVKAGQILGYAGDSGYGEEGTTGQFAVHLHFGIYVKNSQGEEVALNPYPFLKNLTNKILKYF